MSIKTTLIKNTSFNLLGYVYLLLVSFFSIPILLTNLGRDIFGVYLFLASFIPMASVFDFGVSTAVVRALSIPETTHEKKVKIWQTSLTVFIFLAFLIFVTLLSLLVYLTGKMPLFSGIDKSTLNLSILTVSFIAFINHINTHFLTLPQAKQRFDVFNLKTLLVGTANTILSAGVTFLYPSLSAIFFIQIIFHLLTFFFLFSFSAKHFSYSESAPLYHRESGKELLNFGIKNFIGTLANQIENQVSNFILGTVSSATAITAFNIPQNMVAKAAGVVSQFSQAFFPLSASLLTKDKINKLKKMVFSVEVIVFAGGLITTVIVSTFGEAFLFWWLKDTVIVSLAYPVLKVLSWYFVLVSLTPVPTAICQGLNKPQVSSFFGVLTVVIEVGVALTLVSSYHSLGIAYAFLISTLLTVPSFLITTWILLYKETKRIQSPV